VITAEAVSRSRDYIDGLSFGFVRANRTVENAQYQALRAQSRGIIGTQFRSALRAVCHVGQICSAPF
jgi:hypothetical protein